MGGAAVRGLGAEYRVGLVLYGDAVLHPEHIIHLVHFMAFVRGDDGSWTEVTHEKDGSYLLLPAENGTLTFMVEQTEMNWTLFAVGMTVAAVLLVLAAIMLWRTKKGRQTKMSKIDSPKNLASKM